MEQNSEFILSSIQHCSVQCEELHLKNPGINGIFQLSISLKNICKNICK